MKLLKIRKKLSVMCFNMENVIQFHTSDDQSELVIVERANRTTINMENRNVFGVHDSIVQFLIDPTRQLMEIKASDAPV